MRQLIGVNASLLSVACLGLMFLLGSAFRSSASSGAKQTAPTDYKCKVDIANGKEKDCPLVRDKDERLIWYNSSPTQARSVRFTPNDFPFKGHKYCWDVPAGTPADHGVPSPHINPNTPKHDYTSNTADADCAHRLSSDDIRGTPKVIIQ
jgi:hypothetical protein